MVLILSNTISLENLECRYCVIAASSLLNRFLERAGNCRTKPAKFVNQGAFRNPFCGPQHLSIKTAMSVGFFR
jgi:hypothetical protein